MTWDNAMSSDGGHKYCECVKLLKANKKISELQKIIHGMQNIDKDAPIIGTNQKTRMHTRSSQE